jgi:hypothetical protein
MLSGIIAAIVNICTFFPDKALIRVLVSKDE